jgi:hypothetical protein
VRVAAKPTSPSLNDSNESSENKMKRWWPLATTFFVRAVGLEPTLRRTGT